MSTIKEFVKASFRLTGLEVSRFRNTPHPLVYHNIDLLLDVGANVGQYALKARSEGYAKRIVSFEPLSSAYSVLKSAARSDDLWIVHSRSAIGSMDGEIEINMAGNSYSSSILPMLSSHEAASPDSAYVGKDRVPITTLDSVFGDYAGANERVFLKIDTQGYEKAVLDGAKDCIERVDVVQLELSLVPLYEGQELYEYFLSHFRNLGFKIWSLIPGFSDKKTGQLLQFDAVFVRAPKHKVATPFL